MATINFPSSPSLNDTYTFDGKTWVYNGTGWVLAPITSVQSASTLLGGSAGVVPYQSATGVTAFTSIGTAGQLLQSNGTGAPTWTTVSGAGTVTSVSVVSANGFAGTVATATTTPAITLTTSVTGILYGNGTSVAAATAGNFPTLNQSTTGTAALADNITGGLGGQILYQSAASTTAKLANGTAGQVLQSNGTTVAPSWVTVSSGALSVVTVSGTTQTAASGNRYVLTNVAATTVTLSATPTANDVVSIKPANGLYTNVVNPNGATIEGVSGNMTIDNPFTDVTLQYLNSSWRFVT